MLVVLAAGELRLAQELWPGPKDEEVMADVAGRLLRLMVQQVGSRSQEGCMLMCFLTD